MAIYILFSISIFSAVFYVYPAFKTNTHSVNSALDPIDDLKRLLFPAGLTVFYLMTTFLIYYLTRIWMVWKWPIQPVESFADAYARLFCYMPVMVISAFALAWMKKNDEPIRPWFKWGRFTFLFVIGLLASIYYCLDGKNINWISLLTFRLWYKTTSDFSGSSVIGDDIHAGFI